MNQDESSDAAASTAVPPLSVASDATAPAHPNPIGRLASFVEQASISERAALARLDPDYPLPHQMAALSRALIHAGLDPDRWQATTWARWALIAHGMALAGHDGKGRLGEQLAHAGVAESRVTKLLTSRGDAFVQIVPRLLRLMASKGVKPNWHEVGRLILAEQSNNSTAQDGAEDLRLRIAGHYFSTRARQNSAAA